MESPSDRIARTSLAALSNWLSALSPPNCFCMELNASIRPLTVTAAWPSCPFTPPSTSAIWLAPLASLSMSPPRSETTEEASLSLEPTSPAWNDSLACSNDSPVGRVIPRTASMLGS